jgi:hypothetical protein
MEKIFLDADYNPQITQISQIFSMTLKKNRSKPPHHCGDPIKSLIGTNVDGF